MAPRAPIAVDRIISLGTNCEITFHLRSVFGFERAYPFDWWITPLNAIAPILLSRFALDIESDNLEVVGGGRSIINRKYRLLHHHDFPRLPESELIDQSWPAAIGDCRSKFEALGKRFFEDVSGSQRIAFFINQSGGHEFLQNEELSVLDDVHHYFDIERTIELLFPNLEFYMVVSEAVPAAARGALDERARFMRVPDIQDYGDRYGGHPNHFAKSLRGWREALSTLPFELRRA